MRKTVHRPKGRRLPKPKPATQRPEGWTLHAASGQRKYLNADERRRFIAAAERAEPRVRTLCLTLAYIGCRISEALNLTGGDIEVASGLIAVRSLKKRGKLLVRQVPAPPALLTELARVHRLGLDDGIDPTLRLWRWGRTRAWQLVKGVMAAARVGQLPASPKGLRHAFGVHAILSGVSLNLVQRWMGHQDIATTAIYTNVLGTEERAIAARMW